MCSQADDPSQHVSDDTLRAALAMLAPGGAWYGCGEEYLRARFVETLTALAASATDEHVHTAACHSENCLGRDHD